MAINCACLPCLRPLLTSFLKAIGLDSTDDRPTAPTWAPPSVGSAPSKNRKTLEVSTAMIEEEDQWHSHPRREDTDSDQILLHSIKTETSVAPHALTA